MSSDDDGGGKKANGSDVQEHDLYFAYETIREQIVHELFFVHKGLQTNQASLIAGLRSLLSAPLFAEDQLVGPGQQAGKIQKQLGSFLASPDSQDWVARYLAFPVGRKNSSNVDTVRQLLIVEDKVNVTKYNSDFFKDAEKTKLLIETTSLTQEAKRLWNVHKKNLPDGLQQNAVLAAILINFSVRFLLIQSPQIVARRTKSLETQKTEPTAGRRGRGQPRQVEKPTLSGSPDVYALNPFALSVTLQFLKRYKEGRSFLDVFADKSPGALGSGAGSTDKDYLWSALPWRTGVAVSQLFSLFTLQSPPPLSLKDKDLHTLQTRMMSTVKQKAIVEGNEVYVNDRIVDYRVGTVFAKSQIQDMRKRFALTRKL